MGCHQRACRVGISTYLQFTADDWSLCPKLNREHIWLSSKVQLELAAAGILVKLLEELSGNEISIIPLYQFKVMRERGLDQHYSDLDVVCCTREKRTVL